MRLYLDDKITDRRVVAQLHRMGHVVLLPSAVGHSGVSDAKQRYFPSHFPEKGS